MTQQTLQSNWIVSMTPALTRIGTLAAPFVLLAVAWQVAASVFPSYLFPSLVDVFLRFLTIVVSWDQFVQVLTTVGRILAGLAGAFVIGGVFAVVMARSRAADHFLSPILTFFQGIPALSWVVFAIIWFHGTEFRILFIMIVTTLPAFTFQILGALRAVPKDLFEMVLSFRPTKAQMFRTMIWPSVFPEIVTAWKVNLGNAARVVVVAELVGATGGVGYELIQQQQVFDMTGALAWTLQLVMFVIIFQQLLTWIEIVAFRYRATSERSL
ncbi:ABC transporter permease [Pseudorhodoplanes sp.]|uniref:ABC transporter permease n=1 Tax=Pseudorhodoplanes sp. TaxID=1934341 RepID=UPI00391C8A0D